MDVIDLNTSTLQRPGQLSAVAAAPADGPPLVHTDGKYTLIVGLAVHRIDTLAEAMEVLRISISQAARWLRMPRTTAYRVLHEHAWPERMQPDHLAATADALVALLVRYGASRPSARVLVHAVRPDRDVVPAPPELRMKQAGAAKDRRAGIADDQDQEPPMLMAKQTLSPAARKAFHLFVNPFDGEVVSDEQMYTNGEIAYVREACMQAATGGRFVAVVSESGGGKTTMLQDLEARLERDRKPVIVIKPWVLGMEDNDTKGKTLKSTDILASIVTTLDALAAPKQTLQARSNQARDLLIKSTEAGYSHLLMIEEAHSLPEATLKHLKRLHEMRLGRKPLLGILLLGQTELALRLDPRRASLREVTQRCEVVHLMPLDGDLKAYLAHRAKAAGRDLAEFIDDGGVDEIRARLTVARPAGNGKTRTTSLLYPLAVNNLMTACLNVAADLGVPVVTRDVVRGV